MLLAFYTDLEGAEIRDRGNSSCPVLPILAGRIVPVVFGMKQDLH